MTSVEVIENIREAIYILLLVGAPPMMVALGVGLLVSLFQALTQIQEQTLTFVPKILAMMLTLVIFLPFMVNTLTDFSHRLMEKIVTIEADDTMGAQ